MHHHNRLINTALIYAKCMRIAHKKGKDFDTLWSGNECGLGVNSTKLVFYSHAQQTLTFQHKMQCVNA